jgi:hypothetical protein
MEKQILRTTPHDRRSQTRQQTAARAESTQEELGNSALVGFHRGPALLPFTAAARRQLRAALRRISENAAHLQRWREGGFAEGSADWIIGEGLDILARTGGLPKYTEESGERTVVAGKYRRASGGMSAAATW